MKLPGWLAGLTIEKEIALIKGHRDEFSGLENEALQSRFQETDDLREAIAAVAVAASRVLGMDMFDVQLRGALGLARGRIVEMQTGEGKTLACTPAVAWYARSGEGVNVLTVNDYLARRDAQWMGVIYRFFGLS